MQLADAYQLLQSGAIALGEVELSGIAIDVDYCREKIEWIDRKTEQSKRRFENSKLCSAWRSRYGSAMKLGSVPQLRSVLYADLHVKPFKQTEGGDESTDEESLRQTGVEGINHLLRMRRYKKIRDFLSGFLRWAINGRIYPSFLLHTVQTYRSSAADPNLQNVPKRDKEAMDICRRAIIPSKGYRLLEIDFSGVEVSIAACYHQDPTMIDYLVNPSSDMHADMAKQLFFLHRYNLPLKEIAGGPTLRQASKNGFVFPEFYGDYYESCAFNMACSWLKLPQTRDWKPTDGIEFHGKPIGGHFLDFKVEALSDFIEHVKKVESDFWNKRFPVYRKWRENWYDKYLKHGSFDMKTGFHCSGVFGRNQVVNYPVQGSAFHCLLWTLIQVVARIKGWKSRVVGEIHDSLLIDAHPSEVDELVPLVTQIATVELPREWPWIVVPLRVEASISEIDGSWADMKVIEV